MKKTSPYGFLFPVLCVMFSCVHPTAKDEATKVKPDINKKGQTKPPATYQDTLKIEFATAIFYHPDSLQLQKIKEIADEKILEAQMHEYFFQMRNARMVLNKNWPQIKIREAQKMRYLLFIKKNKSQVCIDLNTKNDPYGLFLFEPTKDPLFSDMMNIDTQLHFYFDK